MSIFAVNFGTSRRSHKYNVTMTADCSVSVCFYPNSATIVVSPPSTSSESWACGVRLPGPELIRWVWSKMRVFVRVCVFCRFDSTSCFEPSSPPPPAACTWTSIRPGTTYPKAASTTLMAIFEDCKALMTFGVSFCLMKAVISPPENIKSRSEGSGAGA